MLLYEEEGFEVYSEKMLAQGWASAERKTPRENDFPHEMEP
jgi:hypothetical protein